MYTLESFYSEGNVLVDVVNEFVRTAGVMNQSAADHICFKCDSSITFEQMRQLLEPVSSFVYQSYISGRRIAVIKLLKPFETVLGPITVLELSDQKPNNSQTTRFDHIEIYPVGIPYEELAELIKNTGANIERVERPHHITDDIELGNDFTLKLTHEPLIEKIKRDEMI